MEVHHHSHTDRKKWTHYFWEFFMLFLAVTLGFFVENQREHLIEHKRAKQYAVFLYKDLIQDSINLTERTTFMRAGIEKLDTLIGLLKPFKNNDSSVLKIYDLSAYVYWAPFFSATTSTIDQLKSSGSLRYFGSSELVTIFSKYDTDLQRLKAVENRNAYLHEEARKFLSGFLDLKSISRFTVNVSSDTSGFTLVRPPVSEIPDLYKQDRQSLDQYANLCALKQLDWTTRTDLQTRLLNSMRNLIFSLKEEYHLKD